MNLLTLLSPLSALIGVVVAGLALWLLYPWPEGAAVPLGLVFFIGGATLSELIRRSLKGKKAS